MLQKIIKWLFLIVITGLLVGSNAALFLWLLDQVTELRIKHGFLVYLLPLFGALSGWFYYKTNPLLANGNQYLLQSYSQLEETGQEKTIPFILTPLILIGTLLSHLGGGSVGREGTAVQMGASISSQLTHWIKLNQSEKKLIICMGISAGFAGVFGTPLAASIFAFEFFSFRKTKWYYILPSIFVAYLADFTCTKWGIEHAQYTINPFQNNTLNTIGWICIAGIIFGVTAFIFIQSGRFMSKLFTKIASPIYKPLIGGIIITIFFVLLGQEKMAGLGLSTIADAFIHPQGNYDFIIKLGLTTFTLSAGFKGGEVTPLFFIGAVLGSILIAFIPLPISLLAGLGLVAVFAGATHCLYSSILLGIELFGLEYAPYLILVILIAYLFSGSNSIYEGRPMGPLKKKLAPYFF